MAISFSDELEDDNSNEDGKKLDGKSDGTEPSPGPSVGGDTPTTTDTVDIDDPVVIIEEKNMWPSATDLNTRLRRVITSYQRNVRRDEPSSQTPPPATPPQSVQPPSKPSTPQPPTIKSSSKTVLKVCFFFFSPALFNVTPLV